MSSTSSRRRRLRILRQKTARHLVLRPQLLRRVRQRRRNDVRRRVADVLFPNPEALREESEIHVQQDPRQQTGHGRQRVQTHQEEIDAPSTVYGFQNRRGPSSKLYIFFTDCLRPGVSLVGTVDGELVQR